MFIFEILIMPLLLSSQVLAQLPAEGGNSLGPAAEAAVPEPPFDEAQIDAEDEQPLPGSFDEETATQAVTKTVTGYPRATGTAADSHANIVETSYLSGLVLLTGLFWL